MATPYQLALDEEWDELKNFYDKERVFAVTFLQTAAEDNVFHLAAFSKSKEPLESFLKIAEEDPMAEYAYSAKNIYGNTALHEAAADGNIEAVELLVKHDKKLLEDRNIEGETPLFKAAAYGQTEVVRYLASESEWRKLCKADRHSPPQSPLIDAKRRIGLPILRRILKDKRKHKLAFELTKKLIDQDTTWLQIVDTRLSEGGEGEGSKPGNIQADQVGEGEGSKPGNIQADQVGEGEGSKQGNIQADQVGVGEGSKPIALFLATEKGIVEIVNEILKQTPQLVEYIDDKNRSILHIAIMHRQMEIFDIVKEMNIPMKRLVRGIDVCDYTILHHAADMTNDNADIHRGPAYHLQEELKWHKRVEKLAPTHFAVFLVTANDDNKEDKNCNCKELFELKHNKLLKEAHKWVKETSQSCYAVVVLVATVVVAAAYTVPGGSNDNGYPVFLNNKFFWVFTVMDVVALACSLTSVVMFLSVLTSPFSYEEFRQRLPRKLTIGFSLLFFALTTTMLAFAATLLLIVRLQKPRWTSSLIYTAAFFTVSIFALTQFPMYVAFKATFLKFYKWIKKVHRSKWFKKRLATKFQCYKKKLLMNDVLSKKNDDLV
ncbi:uncharacterized protein LOC116127006 [Pistacia vera]|uniref:uncharacterized protein LOC116127006 n=1 Tax=Pistacia vera TaxID=55513 RepID=UPI001262E54E|nr:uncharacterized protein LOC116127006 [Pistacia vera]